MLTSSGYHLTDYQRLAVGTLALLHTDLTDPILKVLIGELLFELHGRAIIASKQRLPSIISAKGKIDLFKFKALVTMAFLDSSRINLVNDLNSSVTAILEPLLLRAAKGRAPEVLLAVSFSVDEVVGHRSSFLNFVYNFGFAPRFFNRIEKNRRKAARNFF